MNNSAITEETKDAFMNNSAIAEETWDEMEKRLFTPEERAICNSRVALMLEVHDAIRNGIGKKKLAKLSGVKKSVIARMETDDIDPKLGTVLNVLAALGKTLAIVPIDEVLKEDDSQQATVNSSLQ